MPLFDIGMDPVCVLFHQLSKDEFLEDSENQNRQQKIQHGPIRRVSDQSYAKDVKARRTPHKAGEKLQRIAFYFHRLPP